MHTAVRGRRQERVRRNECLRSVVPWYVFLYSGKPTRQSSSSAKFVHAMRDSLVGFHRATAMIYVAAATSAASMIALQILVATHGSWLFLSCGNRQSEMFENTFLFSMLSVLSSLSSCPRYRPEYIDAVREQGDKIEYLQSVAPTA